MFNRLVCRSIFSDRDAVVCEDVRHWKTHQCRETDRWTDVVAKYEERRSEYVDTAVKCHSVQRGTHRKFADAEPHVTTFEVFFWYEVSFAFHRRFIRAPNVCA